MLFFAIVVAAIVAIAVYVTKKTRTPFAEIPTEVETPFDATPMVEEIPPVVVTEASVPTTPPSVPTMTAMPKKNPAAKKKPTKKKTNA
jgi:hypothetical protein